MLSRHSSTPIKVSVKTSKQTNKPNIIYNLIKKELDSLIVLGHGNVVVLANACVVSPTQTWTASRQKNAPKHLPHCKLACQEKYETAFDDSTTVQGTFMNYNSTLDCVDL